jgi:starch synthase (maltosyl-transferring)
MLGRIVIDDLHPRTPDREHPAKAAVGQAVNVSADIFRDGHDILAARLRWRPVGTEAWQYAPMAAVVNDLWEGRFTPSAVGMHEFSVEAWTDRFATWRHDVEIKVGAGQELTTELEEGARLLEHLAPGVAGDGARRRVLDAAAKLRDGDRRLDDRLNGGLDQSVAALLAGVTDDWDLTVSDPVPLWVDRVRAVYGAWYELFPRSEGGLLGAMKRLPAIAEMGFDIVYLPPIHPIGRTARKGRNNTLTPSADDPGSPWAIGGPEGGHEDVHPELGTIEDFDRFVAETASHGMEVALDYALQCSPDHPWVREHPEWFHQRPDGTIKYAENPPKKYQDIYPINFWPADDRDRVALWNACKDVLDHWIDHGVRIFRVDNPHTKPLAFWEWVIPAIQQDHPDVLFLAEAFTRPKMMAKLAEVGFTQSYTYFTWRTEKWELQEYLTELAHGHKVEFMRPNFWPNTPDILSGPLRNGPPAAFMLRALLAATMTSSYGIYSGYELCENQPASDSNEEYLNSEKYEIKKRNWDQPGSLAPFITKLNRIRSAHPCFEDIRNIQFHHADSDDIIVYSRGTVTDGDAILVIANLHPHEWRETTCWIDLGALGLPWDGPYLAEDELSGENYTWNGPHPYVRLDPSVGRVAHVLHLTAR